jgi:hypothetical protein
MSMPPSLFVSDDVIIDLTKVTHVETNVRLDRDGNRTMRVHVGDRHPVCLHDETVRLDFLAAFATYHELYVSPRK